MKFSKAEGVVRISAEIDEEGRARFTIEDNGVGMVEEELELAFEPFVQFGGPGRTREGTVLGLPLTRQLVELYNGKVTLESVPGNGTRAIVLFPANRVIV
ncbi:MAG: ATP-binding protein [Alphaproteobacteria bacterium]|nr:ATP-binding protein [Alphaproteobacteria bacterium]